MTSSITKNYLASIAHLPEAQQTKRIARREITIASERAIKVESGLRLDGCDVGAGLRYGTDK